MVISPRIVRMTSRACLHRRKQDGIERLLRCQPAEGGISNGAIARAPRAAPVVVAREIKKYAYA
jgi:hypothetical protein